MSREPQESEFIDQTIELWQVYSDQPLNAEDAREIVENLAGFFTLLSQWDAERETRGCHDREEVRSPSDRSELER